MSKIQVFLDSYARLYKNYFYDFTKCVPIKQKIKFESDKNNQFEDNINGNSTINYVIKLSANSFNCELLQILVNSSFVLIIQVLKEFLQMEKDKILQALKASLVSNTTVLKNVENFLQKMQKEKGYCKVLMQIFSAPQNDQKIRQAAIIQLKIMVSFKWKIDQKDQQQNQKELCSQQKQYIRDNILHETMKNCRNQTILKVCKKIIQIITDHDAKIWNISDFLIQKLSESTDNIIPVLQIAIGVASGFQNFFSPNKQVAVAFALAMFPCMQIIFNNYFTQQACYLISKLIYKFCHYDLHDAVREKILNWMTNFMRILGDFNQTFEATSDLQNQAKGTSIFYYFHSKKWIARTLSCFFLNHMKTKSSNVKLKDKIETNKKWLSETGKELLQVMYVNLARNQPLKLKFFILRCYEGALCNYPEIVQPMAAALQFQLLPELLKIKRSDVIAAQQEPLQFIANEDASIINWTNVKIEATKVWIDIALIEKPNQKGKSSSRQRKYFNQSLEFIIKLLQATQNPQQPNTDEPYLNKELGMFLLVQISRYILDIKSIQEKVPQILSKYIMPELQNKNMLLKSRAIQVFGAFSQIQMPATTVRVIAKYVAQSLTDPNSQSLVKIKSAIALFYIVRKKDAKDFLKKHLANLLKGYVQIINQFDVQLIVNSFQAFLQAFSDKIYKYAKDLLTCIMMACQRMIQRQSQDKSVNSVDGSVCTKRKFVDSGMGTIQCLKAMITTLQNTCDSQLFVQMEDKIFKFVTFLLQRTGNDFEQEIFMLLTTFIYKRGEIKNEFWFFYVAFIYSISGPCSKKQKIENIPDTIIRHNERHILHRLMMDKLNDLAQQGFYIIRQFIQFGANELLVRKDYFDNTYWQLLFRYIIYPLQDKDPNHPQVYNRDVLLCNSLVLAICFVETVRDLPQKPVEQLWQLVKRIYDKEKTKAVRAFNTQLLCVLIYRSCSIIVPQIYKDNRIEQFEKELCMTQAFLQQDIHQTRIIVGLCQFMKAPCHRQDKIKSIDSIYRTLIQLVGEVIQKRMDIFEVVLPQEFLTFKEQKKQANPIFKNSSLNIKKSNQRVQDLKNNQKFSELLNKFKQINITEKMQDDKKEQEEFAELQLQIDEDDDEIDIGDLEDLDGSILGEMWDQQYGDTYVSKLEQIDQLKNFQLSMHEIQANNKLFADYLKGKLQRYEDFANSLQEAIIKYEQVRSYEEEAKYQDDEEDQQFQIQQDSRK